jgi:hypothetical protein
VAAHRFDESAVVEQLGLVFDVIAGNPGFDLVAHPLKLLYLRLEVDLQLLLLRVVVRHLHLVIYALEDLDAFRDLLQCPVNFGCSQRASVTISEVERSVFGSR